LAIPDADPADTVLLRNCDCRVALDDSMSKYKNVWPTVAAASPFSSSSAVIINSHPLLLYATGITVRFFRNRIWRKFTRKRNKLSKFVITPFLSASNAVN
jgi:hypothetical protein